MAFTVAIDGPAAAGKGTIARAVAAHFGFSHLDTGLLYRAVGMATLDAARGVIDENMAVTMAKTLSETDLARDDLRSARAGQAASKVAAIPEVRSALLKFQQDFARREGGAVLDGRDIGTVICPNAEVKLFVTASDAVRAQRRFAELSATNPALTVAQVAGDLAQRDARDAERAIAPLQPADDAELLDTSTLSIAAAIQSAIATVQKRLK
ncbi:(d)CMP kinase [Abyssibius alkaniclasticus]|uniref:(d)CMP kinase n=1 Tax=Abyssibius alkaniclasticus TaxID=2881234 RepID=UPI002363DC16|nr:(d)CMP kinase [Abyssibius alkaniclasticus]UPH72494.1 (d)CMP kinase [Abyssibius alkaniclasticus]|tara:strand:+ start:279 stop:908 length:630 start_codon:yes stop_codon:yes gene_type:complete